MIVSEVPGTTRDAIDTVFRRGDTTFVLVDTAGLRRKRRQRQGIEYYSELRALEAAERADVALVLVDASEGLVDQDLAVADVARKAQCSTLVVLSKWDVTTVGIEDVRPRIEARLRQRPPVVAVSAKTGRGVGRLLDRDRAAVRRSTRARVPTGELNRFLGELREARQPPAKPRPKRLNLLYGTQVQDRPPRFRFFVNDPGLDDARLRLLGRERAARALRARGRARCRSTSCGARERRVVVGCGVVGDGVRAAARRPRPRRRRSPAATPSRRRRSPRPGATRATCRTPTSRASTRPRSPTRRSRTPTSSSSPCRATRSPTVVAALPGDAPVLSLTKGLDPATGERLSTLVRGPAGRRALRAELRRGGRRRAAGRGRDRERGPRARASGSRTRSTRSSSASTSTTTSSASSSAPPRRT